MTPCPQCILIYFDQNDHPVLWNFVLVNPALVYFSCPPVLTRACSSMHFSCPSVLAHACSCTCPFSCTPVLVPVCSRARLFSCPSVLARACSRACLRAQSCVHPFSCTPFLTSTAQRLLKIGYTKELLFFIYDKIRFFRERDMLKHDQKIQPKSSSSVLITAGECFPTSWPSSETGLGTLCWSVTSCHIISHTICDIFPSHVICFIILDLSWALT